MPASPLTHHEIVRLVEPFVRQGRHVDLVASDRAARRIVFKPAQRPVGELLLEESLELDAGHDDRLVLRRTLTPPQGFGASLQATGDDLAGLLARIDSVSPAQHFSAGAGYTISRSYDATPPGTRPGSNELALTRAQVRVDGLVLDLVLTMPGLRNVAADLTLRPSGRRIADLPEDVLAVLGWDWARLIRTDAGWTSKLRLRGAVLRRSRTAEAALERAGLHLARVLAQPPSAFHAQHRWARWAVVLRRGIPSLTALGMVTGALLLPYVTDPAHSGLWMALHYVPIALLAFSFKLQELPRFEIPPWPRRSRLAEWTDSASAPPAD